MTEKTGSLKKKFMHASGLILLVILGYILANVFLVALFTLLGFLGITIAQNNVTNTLVNALMFAAMLGAIFGGYRLFAKKWPSRKLLGLEKRPEFADVGYALGGVVLYFIVGAIVSYAITKYAPWIDLNQKQETGFSSPSGSDIYLIFLLLVIVAPVIEEVIFRGFLFGALKKTGVPFWLNAVLVSVVFAAAHLQLNVAINVFVLSMIMCIVREVQGSIWGTILMHMLKNGLAFYILFVSPFGPLFGA